MCVFLFQHSVCCVLSCFSRVQLFATPWTVACQAPLFDGISRQEYWSGLPCPLPGDLSDPGIKPTSPALQVDSLPSEPQGSPMTVFYNWWHHVHTALVLQNFPHYSCILLFIYKNFKINKLIL